MGCCAFCSVGFLGAFLQLRSVLLPSFGESFAVSERVLGLIASAAPAGALILVSAVGTAISRIDVRLLPAGAWFGLVKFLTAVCFGGWTAVTAGRPFGQG